MAKLSVSRAWDETKAVLKSDGRLIAAVALAMIVLPGTVNDMAMPPAPPGEIPEPGAWLIVALVTILVGIVGQLAIIRLASGSRMTVGEAIRHGARRALAYIGATLIWVGPFAVAMVLLVPKVTPAQPNAGAAAAFLLLVGLMLFLFVRLLMSAPVATNEQAGPVQILQRSWALTRGNWWRLFGFLMILLVMVFVLMIAINAVVGTLISLVMGASEPLSVGALIISLFTQLAMAVVSVIFLLMLARFYAQLSGPAHESVTVPSSGT
jgi:hypothetical protein